MLVDRAKLLDFAANRLRSWRSEYQLYSVRVNDPTEVRTESDSHPPMGADSMASTISTSAEPISLGVTGMASNDFLSTPTGSVDTLSITGLLPDAVLSKVSPSRPLKYSASRSIESTQAHASSDAPGVKIHRSTDEVRTRIIKPLTEMLDAPPGAKSALSVRFIRPKVVAQIMGDNKEHWARLAGGISLRVQESGLKTLMLTSALRGEGVTTLSTALAVALAENTKLRVLLLEGDFQSPTLARDLDVHPAATIDQCLFGEASLEDSLVTFTQPAFHVVPASVSLDSSLASTAYGRINDMLISFRDHFDLVLLDLGGLFVGRKPIPVPSAVDAALLVRDASKTGPELFDQLDAYLARQGVASLGVIENGV